MITSLRMVNFKNFADETLKLGPFTVIVGANASGKSNIRDAFRFLHGIGRGYTLAEVIEGKYGEGEYLEWSGIRGGSNEIIRFGEEGFSLHVNINPYPDLELTDTTTLTYQISIRSDVLKSGRFYADTEVLYRDSEVVYSDYMSGHGQEVQESSGRNLYLGHLFDSVIATDWHEPKLFPTILDRIPLWRRQATREEAQGSAASLTSIDEYDDKLCVLQVLGELIPIKFVELSPDAMRRPTPPAAVRLGTSGENLPSVLRDICEKPQRKGDLLSWLEELSPMDVAGLEFPIDPSGRVHLQIVERNGRRVSAYSASDGTLRFLGLLAALFSENRGGLYFFEEIDNGIHPNRLGLLIDLIERQVAKGDIQVVTTTHSPALLDWLRDEAFENTSLVYRDDYWKDSVIRPISGLYDLRELRKGRGLGKFLTGGWMEDAMHFSEGESDVEHLDDDDDDGDGVK